MPATFGQNNSYFQSVNNVHNCLLSLSSAGAQVEKVQIRSNSTVVMVSNAAELEHTHEVSEVTQGDIKYKQTNLYGCNVVWEAA
jgi:hypothetical protein